MTASLKWIALTMLATACSSLPWWKRDFGNHPAALVGDWVDVEKSSPRDSSFWVLREDGDDDGLRITRTGSGNEAPHVARQHFGYWYVHTASGGAETLCVTRRPGRDPAACTPVETTVDSTVAPPRRVVRLAAYAGAHHTGSRVLVERR
jgi:hypothetical protein